MNQGIVVKWSLVFSFVFGNAGALMKILHLQGGDILLIIGILAYGIFIFSALSEVWGSVRINTNIKIMWTIAFIFLGFLGALAGILYVLIGRKRVV